MSDGFEELSARYGLSVGEALQGVAPNSVNLSPATHESRNRLQAGNEAPSDLLSPLQTPQVARNDYKGLS